jgi:hypothetical protein
VALRRWPPWASLTGLTLLTVGAAAFSVTTTSAVHVVAPVRPSFTPTATTATTATTTSTTATATTTPRLLTVSATDLRVGDQVTVTGTGCPPGHWGTPVVQSDDDPFVFSFDGLYNVEEYLFTPAGDEAGGTVGPDGLWTATGRLQMIPPGPATLTGWCMPQEGDDGASIEFDYTPGLRVIVTTPYQLAVEQGTTVDAGTTIDVNLLGGTCGDVASPQVDLYTGAQVQVVAATVATGSGWQFTLALPPGLTPGQYRLEADCVLSRGAVYGSYAPTTITVR